MSLSFLDIPDLVNRRKTASFSARSVANEAGSLGTEAFVSDTMGYHIYGDLNLTLSLSAADDQSKANLYLEILEDYAHIASKFAELFPDLLIFEVQGERIHLFLNKREANEQTATELLEFSNYFTSAIYGQIKPKAGAAWKGFCMAADHGRAVVISTGGDGDDSLISLGNPANAPAKRLAQDPAVKSGYLAVNSSLLTKWGTIKERAGNSDIRGWMEINVNYVPSSITKTASTLLFEQAIANSKSDSERIQNRVVSFSTKTADVIPVHGATTDAPKAFQAFMMRADLDGFTKRVQTAFLAGGLQPLERNVPVQNLVREFLQIMKLPDAFEKHLGCDIIRLPWAGDCYNAIILPKDYETYQAARKHILATVPLKWLDPDGEVNRSRDPALARVALQNKWSVGIAGGGEAESRLMVANIDTAHRRFLVVAGWGARRSLDAQNVDDLRQNETAIHNEDHSHLDTPFKNAFNKRETEAIQYRRASASDLSRASEEQLRSPNIIVTPRSPAIVAPSSRPYYG